MRPAVLIAALAVLGSFSSSAQTFGDMEDESRLYAETKQVNQFFRRFNGEEDEKGDRYFPRDRQYRDEALRKKYIARLFDASNTNITDELKIAFAKDVLDKSNPKFLDFHGDDWLAQVRATFIFNGINTPVILFLKLEQDHLGYKWVISSVFVERFLDYFERDTTKVGRFLHPLSHELEFMNLKRAFEGDSISQFTVRKFTPDHLSLFLYEIQKGNMKFRQVNEVKFHFMQIDGWYFELSQFNRAGYNRGWLISGLTRLNSESEKEVLKRYLLYETQ